MCKGIIFDFNGVLWWDHHLQARAWREISTSLRGHPLSKAEMASEVYGRSNRDTIAYLLDREPKEYHLKQLIEEKEAYYQALCLGEGKAFRLSPGAIYLLDQLKLARIPRTIATASEISNMEFFFHHLSLGTWFDFSAIVYDDRSRPGKPAPDTYLCAAAKLDLAPSECMVVEDSESGLKAAPQLGLGLS